MEMKRLLSLVGIFSLWICSAAAQAAFVSGSTGALGAFTPAADTVVTLPSDGVLNYTTVNIPAGVTVTFQKNAANTPVYLLATGDVTVSGTISLDAQSLGSANGTTAGAGGPGGYNGGIGGSIGTPGGKAMGPGGGDGGIDSNNIYGGGGGYASSGGRWSSDTGAGGTAYGNARIVPLVGGSGGGGGAGFSTSPGFGGAGGGGAILIASSGAVNVTNTGSISANGGTSYIGSDWWTPSYGGSGSGGAIRLVANSISGGGYISAVGGNLWRPNSGGNGRVRFEAYSINSNSGTNPPYSYGLPGNVFAMNVPTLTITSIAGANAPASPTGSYFNPDIFLPSSTTNPVAVNVSATNIPDGTTVTVWVIPQYGSSTNVNTVLSGSAASANVNLSTTYSNIVTAQATFTVVGMYYNGEEIDRVRVATKLGGGSETTYITKAGKEIKGELVAALMK
jgi:hypothetical protein